MPATPLKTFIIYARADEDHKQRLLMHLRLLVVNKMLTIWHDGEILPGEDWQNAIKKELKSSELVIVLVSVESLNSDFIQTEELRTALERLNAGLTRVVPVIVSPCLWKYDPVLSKLQALPTYPGKGIFPVSIWNNHNHAWASVAEGIGDLAQEILKRREEQGEETVRQAEAERTAPEQREAAAREAGQLKQKEATTAEKAERTRHRIDEAAWKKVTEGLQVAQDLPQKIALLEAYLHDETHQNHRAEAEEQLEDFQVELEADRRLEAARKKREAEQQKEQDLAEQKRLQKETEAERQKNLPEMVFVQGGTFKMGDNYQITLSDFEIGKHPVTQKLWKDIMGDNPSHFKGDDLPVETVSWDDCQRFLQNLNERYPEKNYRLPTEAEWEFAARGGTLSKGYEYAGGNDLKEVGWYKENSGGKTHSVGQKKANELDVFDMSGNVWEWCQDWRGIYPSVAQIDPKGPDSGSYRVIRGGSWYGDPQNCRAANRGLSTPGDRDNDVGFRLARTF